MNDKLLTKKLQSFINKIAREAANKSELEEGNPKEAFRLGYKMALIDQLFGDEKP